jgi:hypothetical protein
MLIISVLRGPSVKTEFWINHTNECLIKESYACKNEPTAVSIVMLSEDR